MHARQRIAATLSVLAAAATLSLATAGTASAADDRAIIVGVSPHAVVGLLIETRRLVEVIGLG